MKKFYIPILFSAILLTAGCEKDNLPKIATAIAESTDLYGVVTDTDGNYLSGVTVSDGYSCAVTDENGVYQLTSNEYSYQVFISIPEDCAVPMDNGLPRFWKQITKGVERYDFELTRIEPETEFDLFCIADPQCQTTANVNRFASETVPDVAAAAAASTVPVYGLVLGDVCWNTASTDYTNGIMPLMRIQFKQENIGVPLFLVMGNHDYKVISASEYSDAHDIAAQRNFEYLFGPVNYSFNRGNAHIVMMDNMLFTSHNSYALGFRDDQVEWLKQDLANVPKDKVLILGVHVPMRANTGNNVSQVLELISGFAHVHIMSGHTHYIENTDYGDRYEHVHGAACGAWWRTYINADGTPNGYAIYNVRGSGISQWQYKSVGFESDYQLRLYEGGLPYFEGYSGQYSFASGYVYANVWNSDRFTADGGKSNWKVEIHLKDGKTYEMEKQTTARDAWASGLLIGVLGRSTGSDYDRSNVTHLWRYQTTADQVEKVVATDPFGNVYEQTEFTLNTAAGFPEALLQ